MTTVESTRSLISGKPDERRRRPLDGMTRGRQPNAGTIGLICLGFSLLGLFAWIGSTSTSFISSSAPAFLGLGLLCCIGVFTRPIIGAVALLAFGFISPGLLPPVFELGAFSVRFSDAFFVAILLPLVFRFLISSASRPWSRDYRFFSPLFPFLGCIALSLLFIAVSRPHYMADSSASFVRLVATMAMGIVFSCSLSSWRDVRLFHRMVVAYAVVSVFLALIVGLFDTGWSALSLLGSRHGGYVGINSLGLVSAFLVVCGVVGKGTRLVRFPLPMALVGVSGLLLSKSVSSLLAAVAGLVYYYCDGLAKSSGKSRLRRLVTLGLVVLLLLPVFVSGRQSDIEGLLTLSGGSFAARTMIMTAAFKIIAEHPLIGVGWQMSSRAEILEGYELRGYLLEEFQILPLYHFSRDAMVSLHNMYLQIAAELGLIGFAVFAWGALVLWRRIRNVGLELTPGSGLHDLWSCYRVALLVVAVWWNGNPLYGGQTESILAVACLAILSRSGSVSPARGEIPPAKRRW